MSSVSSDAFDEETGSQPENVIQWLEGWKYVVDRELEHFVLEVHQIERQLQHRRDAIDLLKRKLTCLTRWIEIESLNQADKLMVDTTLPTRYTEHYPTRFTDPERD